MKKQVIQKSVLCLLMAMLCLPMAMQAKVEHLLPKVHTLNEIKGTPFALQRAVTITDANNTAALKKVFTDYGCDIQDGASAAVTVQMVESIEGAYDYTLEGYDNEGYQLIVTENSIVIKAVKPIGVIRAAQTLAQLAEGYEENAAAIETVEITDWAAFKLRGYMHDVGRSFISVAELKKHIDLLSRFKVNTFHWHFTENQAWRFEVEGYPQLTSTESMTRFEGKYYTQAECREVAQYAHERGVTIIPEIDMPGHSAAFKRAMGFGMQTDEGVEILKKVLTQVADVFPNAPYIHIGADEETIEYPNFLGIMADHIHGLGRKMIVWNPISGVSINKTMCDMTQMWSSSGKNIDGVPDIDCRYNYTNHFDVFADVVGIYKSNIYYADKGSSEIAGTISAYWNDRKTPTEEDIVKQNNMYANVLASAERAWMGSKVNGAEGYIEKLGTTLPNSGEVYEEFKDWETRFLFHKANSLKDEPIPYVKQTNVRWRITDPFPNGGNSAATFAPDQYATSTNDDGLIPETFEHEGKTYNTGMATGAGIYLRHVWGNNIIPTYYGSTNYSNMTAYAWTYVYSETEQTVGAQIEFQNYGRSEHDKTPYADKWDRKGSDIWINGARVNPPTWVNPDTDPSNEDDLQNENFTAREPIEVTLKQGWNKVFLKLPYVGADGIRLNKWMFTCVFTDLEGKNAVEGLIYSPNQCKDEATELVAAKISEIKRDRGNLIGTAIGLWPESAATTLDAKVKEIEATYSEEKTAEERAAQVEALETAWTTFTASLTDANMNLPISGNYYRMYTPQRESRYPTGKGAGSAIIGEQNPTTKASIWQFVKRSDNAYDIINLADGTYISPASSNNTALNCVTEQPNAGWTVKKASTRGQVIIASGEAQFNQTGSGQSYKLYNWGYGSVETGKFNTTDTGCQYELIDVTASLPPQPLVKLEGLGSQTYPYAIDGALADKVFAKENITIALDVMMPASMSGRQALVCAADPTENAVTDAIGTNPSPYVAGGLNGSNLAYMTSSRSSDIYTQRGVSFSASTKYQIVFVLDKTNNTFKSYVNGANEQTNTLGSSFQDFAHLATHENAKLYIGGGAVNGNASYDKFAGQIRSVQFFEGALDAAKIAEIEYPINAEDLVLSDAVAANNNMNIYGLQRHLGLVQSSDNYLCNYPSDPADGQGYPGLLDGNHSTYFHSGYSGRNPSPDGVAHYLQADLGKAVKSFRFYTRKRNDNDRPTKITIEGSNDKNSWSEVKVIEGIPTNAADYYSEEITSTTAYQHYRFTVNTTNANKAFFTFSEFYIFPGEYTKVAETFDAVRAYRAGATVETATALNAVYAWNKGLSEGSPIVGVESYIYADTKQGDGSYVARYLYNSNGTLATSTTRESSKVFAWIASQPEGTTYYTFQNAGDNTKYLGYGNSGSGLTVHTTPVQLDIQSSYAVHTGSVGVMRIGTDNAGKWMVTKADGTSFNRNSVKVNDGSWCSDYMFIPTDLYEQTFEPVVLKSAEEFENGGIYTFVTKRGWMGATAGSNNVISTARTSVNPAASATNAYFQWAVYKSAKGNYYLYNIGKGKYMGVQSSNNTSVPFVDAPNNKLLTFKQSSNADYPIMFSTDNKGVVNHSGDHGEGLVTWTDGWEKLDDEGSNHQVTLVGSLSPAVLKSIADLVDESEADQVQLYIKAEVEGLEENNPNTHFGTVRVTSKFGGSSIKLKRTPGVATIEYLETPTTVIDFTRAYRGFEFQGFFLGEENLGASFTPDENLKNSVSEQNPLIAKFRATEDVTLFYDDDEFSYRIPAIATTSTGRLIAVSDYRHNLDDIGRDVHGTGKLRLDLVMRYSDDNGKTWSAKQTIAEGTGNKNADGYDCAYGDAAIATVGQNVLVMAAAGNVCYPYASADSHNRTVRVFSADNGATWTKEDISEKIFIGANALIPNGHAAFFGSGKLAVDANFNGTGKARIYGAMLVKNASTTTNIYPIYTDDLGLNWKILGGSTSPVANADEPKIEILPNGQILLSARRVGGRHFNVFTYGTGENDKANGVGSWNGAQDGCGNTGGNGTNGEIYCIDAVNANGDAVKLLMQSQPKGGSGHYDRKDVSIWYKEVSADATYTTADIKDGWTLGMQVSTQQSSYSAMSLQDDGKIAFFFEEAPCYGDDYTKGYCMVYVPLTIEQITKEAYSTPEIKDDEEDDEVASADALPGDGILRYYRLAIGVTKSAYDEDLGSSYDKVKAFWQECEKFVNKMYIPLGMCFDVVVDERLVMSQPNLIDENIYNATGFGTELLDEAIGSGSYDVGIWVRHCDIYAENTGLAADGGAYSSATKGSAYAMTDKRVVAHEMGHLFGAIHTTYGEGSLMDNPDGEYFSYPIIKVIRNEVKGKQSYKSVEVNNNAPQFNTEKMQKTYRIPQGACLAIDVQATDIENHKLMYTAIGCNSSNVDDILGEYGMMPVFASFAPQESNIISYSPIYTADVNDDDEDFFIQKEGTGLHEMEAGSYPLSILVNDVPSMATWTYSALEEEPFYSTYAIWEAQVEIVEGEAFNATIESAETEYTAGEEITVKWGVNEAYFSEDSRVRISLSDDYGKTFDYVLAEEVSALAGSCTVTLPNVNIGQVDVDFTTAVRKMNGGVIKVEEIGGAAYTLTVLDPNNDKGFTIQGTATALETTVNGQQTTDIVYDLMGRRVENLTKGIYIVNGKKIIK